MNANNQSLVLAAINENAELYLDAFVGYDQAHDAIVGAMRAHNKPTYAQYQEWRDTYAAIARGHKSLTAANRAWNRLVQDAGVTIPKSTNDEAVKKAEQRDKAKIALEGLTDAELDKAVQTAALSKDFKAASKYQSELARRGKEIEKQANRPAREALDAVRAALPKPGELKPEWVETLNKIRQLLESMKA